MEEIVETNIAVFKEETRRWNGWDSWVVERWGGRAPRSGESYPDRSRLLPLLHIKARHPLELSQDAAVYQDAHGSLSAFAASSVRAASTSPANEATSAFDKCGTVRRIDSLAPPHF